MLTSVDNKKFKFPKAIFAAIMFYIVALLFIGPDYFNIGVPADIRQNIYLPGGIPFRAAAFFLALGITFFMDKDFIKIMMSRKIIIFLIFISFFALIGIVEGNNLINVRKDFTDLLYFILGIALFRLLIQTKFPIFHLLMLVLVMTLMMYLAIIYAAKYLYVSYALGNVRIEEPIVFYYSSMLMVPTCLLLILGNNKSKLYTGITILLLFIHFYNGVILSATRSIGLVLVIIIIFCFISIHFLKKLPSNIKRKRIHVINILVIILCIVIVGLAIKLLGQSIFFSRITSEETLISSSLRLEELKDAFSQAGLLKLILGGGLGYSFYSILGYNALSPHIGLMTFLFKFGLVPFIIIASFLLILMPWYYFKACSNLFFMEHRLRMAVLVVSPGIFAWTTLLCVSGGYTQYNFIAIGIGIAAFYEISSRGLIRLK